MTLQEAPDIGEVVLHHTADAYSIGIEPFFSLSWERWPDLHLGGLTVNLTPTKHTFFLVIAALLVFLTMWIAGRLLERQRAHERAPSGFANAIEAMVLFVRNDMAIANIGADGAKYAPYIMTLFFFILYANLLGLIPHGATATGNVAVTGALAITAFFVIEISGLIKLGPQGYLRTIFPRVPGLSGAGAVAMSIIMAPIEVASKFVKPFALCVRLFGNMTAGHFVILSLVGIVFLFGHLPGWNWGIGGLAALTVLGIMLIEIFVAFLQAYVFALLTAVFIGLMQHEH
ncbi:MAG: F0F1 ATP synthase subunit A [Gemmatimonadales bacterium]|nr:F0F1 ATP synthase subunit A [Gemmatimonadales bacterium]NIN49092.1 F0F1 ATP synthase subunit A [Gemmatimonadales bacterium]NIP06556.1 F0F1 ATP synthase subunit A [Gemmatimonadales bacterium]NIR00253.1 F0F1 ATP synthase subunit A [Gemmatimonadales bacterium]NIS64586.1 F0F1 ATP synthase subunit A [Gemmatimonadales bacterium]